MARELSSEMKELKATQLTKNYHEKHESFSTETHGCEFLRQVMKKELPGWKVQRRLEPELSYGRHFGPVAPSARPASVLILLYPSKGTWHIPFTVRPEHLKHHAGQISFPGGRVEEGEVGVESALRELEEEVGVSEQGIEVLGSLSSIYLYSTNFLVTPWVAFATQRPNWKINPSEVAEILEIPLSHFFREETWGIHQRCWQGVHYSVPHFAWEEHLIWGATGMMLAELVKLMSVKV